MMFKRVLVPVDGSAVSEGVLPLASVVAREADWKLVRAIDVSLVREIEFSSLSDVIVRDARAHLESVATRFAPQLGRVNVLVDYGDPTSVILREAQPEERDLIAMTTHGRTGLDRFMLGSVAEKVVRASRLPVLVARNQTTPRVKSIVVALDGSPESETSLATAETLAREQSAAVTFLHVVEPTEYPHDSHVGRFERRLRS
jgi:nucleotide-binding universal stress UspA family protein